MLNPNEEIIVPIDVDAALISYLKIELGNYTPKNYHVSSVLPKNQQDDTYYIWLHSFGGGSVDRFAQLNTVSVNILGPSEDSCFSIATIIQGILRVLPLYNADITSVEPQTPILPTSEEDETPSFFLTFSVTSRNKTIERI